MTISVSGPTGITVETDPLALKLTGGGISGDLTVTQKVGIGGVVPVGATNKLAVHNGNIVFSAGYGIAFGDGTSLTTAPVAPNLSGYALLSGASFTGKVSATATASTAGINVGTVTATPTSTVNGDIWIGTTLSFRNTDGANRSVPVLNSGNVFSATTSTIPIIQSIQGAGSSQPSIEARHFGTGPALLVSQRGIGYALLVEDSNPDSSPTFIDSEGNVGIGVQGTGGYKLFVNGPSFFGTGITTSGFVSCNALTVVGQDVRDFVFNKLFSGDVVKSGSDSITANINYFDGTNYWSSGGNDNSGNEIPSPQVGGNPWEISWSGSNLQKNYGTTWYYSLNYELTTFTISGGSTVTVYSDGNGGLIFNPPSQ